MKFETKIIVPLDFSREEISRKLRLDISKYLAEKLTTEFVYTIKLREYVEPASMPGMLSVRATANLEVVPTINHTVHVVSLETTRREKRFFSRLKIALCYLFSKEAR